jgi:hypothetical protein
MEHGTEEAIGMTFSKIAIGVGFSELSPEAVRLVAEVFADGSELVLVHLSCTLRGCALSRPYSLR